MSEGLQFTPKKTGSFSIDHEKMKAQPGSIYLRSPSGESYRITKLGTLSGSSLGDNKVELAQHLKDLSTKELHLLATKVCDVFNKVSETAAFSDQNPQTIRLNEKGYSTRQTEGSDFSARIPMNPSESKVYTSAFKSFEKAMNTLAKHYQTKTDSWLSPYLKNSSAPPESPRTGEDESSSVEDLVTGDLGDVTIKKRKTKRPSDEESVEEILKEDTIPAMGDIIPGGDIGNIHIQFCRGSIVDGNLLRHLTNPPTCIVNAAQAHVMGASGGGVDGDIHRAANKGLSTDLLKDLPKQRLNIDAKGHETLVSLTPSDALQAGQSCISASGALTEKGIHNIIHTLAPQKSGPGGAEKLKEAYYHTLVLARNQGITSLAMPGLGSGVYGWSGNETVQALKTALEEFSRKFPDQEMQIHLIDTLQGGSDGKAKRAQEIPAAFKKAFL
jgi:O-acetyl-ADP-ribose deacetylase (regulator of RNase III)